VAELAGWTELEEISSTGGTKLAGVNQCGRRSICEYDLSFDAILPLVRGLKDQDNFWKLLKNYWGVNRSSFVDWLIFEATPADYCRAYVAAKKEQPTPAQQEK